MRCFCRQKRVAWALVPVFFLCASAPAQAGNREAGTQPAWSFTRQAGQPDRLWQAGKTAQDLQRQAVSGRAASQHRATGTASQGRSLPSEENGRKVVREIRDTLDSLAHSKGPLNVELEENVSQWRGAGSRPDGQPDEVLPLGRTHVLRARADYSRGDAVHISVGPELLVKEQQHHQYTSSDTGPDSELGVGMQFQIRF